LGLFGEFTSYDHHENNFLLDLKNVKLFGDILLFAKSNYFYTGIIFNSMEGFTKGQVVQVSCFSNQYYELLKLDNSFYDFLNNYTNKLESGYYLINRHNLSIDRYPVSKYGSDTTTNGVRIRAKCVVCPLKNL
jgi:hypothetical protein